MGAPQANTVVPKAGGRRALEARSYERGTANGGASPTAETVAAASEERRLKAGGSQDWLPHKALGISIRSEVFQRV
jgi:hypothetical protein